VVAAKLRIPGLKPVSIRPLFRAAVALILAFALLLGSVALAGAIDLGGGKMPCDMQMGAADAQALPDNDGSPEQGSVRPACPMMLGGVCLMLAGVAPATVGLADPPHAAVRGARIEEAGAPHVVPPLRRPPRTL
jgi:hypothetical protein